LVYIKEHILFYVNSVIQLCILKAAGNKTKKNFSVQELMGTFAGIIHDCPFIES
jgi:hypothetical protein